MEIKIDKIKFKTKVKIAEVVLNTVSTPPFILESIGVILFKTISKILKVKLSNPIKAINITIIKVISFFIYTLLSL